MLLVISRFGLKRGFFVLFAPVPVNFSRVSFNVIASVGLVKQYSSEYMKQFSLATVGQNVIKA